MGWRQRRFKCWNVSGGTRWFEGGVSCRGGRLLDAIHTILVLVGIRGLCHDVQVADLPRRVPFIAQTLILGVAHAAARARARGIFFRASSHHVTPVRLVTDYDRVTAGAVLFLDAVDGILVLLVDRRYGHLVEIAFIPGRVELVRKASLIGIAQTRTLRGACNVRD